MKFTVIIPVRAIVTFEVEAADQQEAKFKALEELKNNGEKYAVGVTVMSGPNGVIEVHDG